MTQMIAHYAVAEYATFKTAFDADAEDRGNAGLSLLQLWREDGGSAWALYSVADAQAARVLYVPAYAFGWSPWRSLIWAVGFIATLTMIVVSLF